MKSEPSAYSIDDLCRDKKTVWDGVRNYQVRNMFRDTFAPGDKALFYHSNTKEIGVVGEMKVVTNGIIDQLQFDVNNEHYDPKSIPTDPRWFAVTVAFLSKFSRTVTLQELKVDPILKNLKVSQKGNRLSVTPLTTREYDRIVSLGNTTKL